MMTMVMVVVGDVATDPSTEGGMFRRNDLLLFLCNTVSKSIDFFSFPKKKTGEISPELGEIHISLVFFCT